MDKFIEDFVNFCEWYQTNQNVLPSAPAHTLEKTKTPRVRIHVDYVGSSIVYWGN